MKIYNGTPHEIKLIKPESAIKNEKIRKYVSENPTYVGEIPSDGILSAKIETKHIKGYVYQKQITGIDTLPEGYDYYIVSALYASAYKMQNGQNDKLYTVADPVYTTDGKTILGSLGICKSF